MMSKVILFAFLLVSANQLVGAQLNTTEAAPTSEPTINASTASPTTTEAPTTTSLAPTTTTPAEPENTFAVKDGNVTCVKMLAKIEFVIPYEKNNSAENSTVTVVVDKDATASGKCGNESQTLDITFNKNWMLSYTFEKNSDSNSEAYHLGQVTFQYVLDSHFKEPATPGKTVKVTVKPDADFLKSTGDGYYICNAKSNLDVEGVTVSTNDLKYRAFNEEGDIDFKTGTVSECSADEDTNSIVPIAVGAALAGLVVIVLIAYLIGRKRTRKTGYESV